MYTPYTSLRHSILCNENLVVLVEADNNRAHIHRTGSSVDDDGGDCDASAVVVAEEDALVGWIADGGGGGGVIVACCSRCCNCRCYLRRSFVSVVAVASVLRVNALHRSACYVLFKIAKTITLPVSFFNAFQRSFESETKNPVFDTKIDNSHYGGLIN